MSKDSFFLTSSKGTKRKATTRDSEHGRSKSSIKSNNSKNNNGGVGKAGERAEDARRSGATKGTYKKTANKKSAVASKNLGRENDDDEKNDEDQDGAIDDDMDLKNDFGDAEEEEEDEFIKETPAQKRLRLAKSYLEKVQEDVEDGKVLQKKMTRERSERHFVFSSCLPFPSVTAHLTLPYVTQN